MKADILQDDKLEKKFKIEIPANDLDKQMEARLMKEAAGLQLQGFRKGKAPMSILKQRFGRMVLGEVIENAVQSANMKLFKDKDIKPATQPQIEMDQDFDLGKDLKYTITVQIIPPVKVMDVSAVKLTRETAEAGEEEVKNAFLIAFEITVDPNL